MASDVGKWFETRLRENLKAVQVSHGLFYYRLPDSRTAGKIMSNSPADFLVGFNGQAQLWEAKASQKHETLRSCLSSAVSDSQVGYHNLWRRNGLKSWFLFYSDLLGDVEIWPGDLVVECRTEGRPLPVRLCEHIVSLKELHSTVPELFS